jgi:hypothetical protein
VLFLPFHIAHSTPELMYYMSATKNVPGGKAALERIDQELTNI